jgi:N-acetylneuraminate synthase
MNLGGIKVGDNEPVYMIAEIGLNHNGDIQIAKQLIDATFATGWHCAKFQKRTPELCVPEHQKNVTKETPWGTMTYLEYRHRVEFGKEYKYIDSYCKEKPVSWTASAWDRKSLDFLLEFDVPFIKIPSAKLTDHELILTAANSGKPVILSTGMSTVEEIDTAVGWLENRCEYALMHTNSTYPTPLQDLNLKTIQFLKARYGGVIGYSGHEYGLEPTVIAVALGARIIERHVTLDHLMWGSDQAASLEIHAMDMLYKRIKEADLCLGDGIKRVYDSEISIIRKLRA